MDDLWDKARGYFRRMLGIPHHVKDGKFMDGGLDVWLGWSGWNGMDD